jgi:hypothetical protein
MEDVPMAIEDLLAEFDQDSRYAYTRERYDADRSRLVVRLCEKHGITEDQIDSLIREHRYAHTDEDPEEEWMEIMAFAKIAGWP